MFGGGGELPQWRMAARSRQLASIAQKGDPRPVLTESKSVIREQGQARADSPKGIAEALERLRDYTLGPDRINTHLAGQLSECDAVDTTEFGGTT